MSDKNESDNMSDNASDNTTFFLPDPDSSCTDRLLQFQKFKNSSFKPTEDFLLEEAKKEQVRKSAKQGAMDTAEIEAKVFSTAKKEGMNPEDVASLRKQTFDAYHNSLESVGFTSPAGQGGRSGDYNTPAAGGATATTRNTATPATGVGTTTRNTAPMVPRQVDFYSGSPATLIPQMANMSVQDSRVEETMEILGILTGETGATSMDIVLAMGHHHIMSFVTAHPNNYMIHMKNILVEAKDKRFLDKMDENILATLSQSIWPLESPLGGGIFKNKKQKLIRWIKDMIRNSVTPAHA